MKKIIQLSLSFLWVFTGLTSIFWGRDIGYDILLKVDIKNMLADIFIYGGGILDVVIGVWLLTSFQIRKCCLIQIILIVVYSILITVIEPSFWLHPFGPIVKNIPVIVLIFVLYKLEEEVL